MASLLPLLGLAAVSALLDTKHQSDNDLTNPTEDAYAFAGNAPTTGEHLTNPTKFVNSDDSFITNLSMDIDYGNTIFNVGNKSRNTFIEILIGGDIQTATESGPLLLKEMVIVEPERLDLSRTLERGQYLRSPGLKKTIDLKLAKEYDFSNDRPNESGWAETPDYIDLSALPINSLLMLKHPESNAALANESAFSLSGVPLSDPADNGPKSGGKVKGNLCTSRSITARDEPLPAGMGTHINLADHIDCIDANLFENIEITPALYNIQDLTLHDVFEDIYFVAEIEATGNRIQFGHYNKHVPNIDLESCPTNQFDREFNVMIGGFHRNLDESVGYAYNPTLQDKEDVPGAYRWQPTHTLGRLLTNYKSFKMQFDDLHGKHIDDATGRSVHHATVTDWEHPFTAPYTGVRPLEMWSELTWGASFDDHRIHWNVATRWFHMQRETNFSDTDPSSITFGDIDIIDGGYRTDNNIFETKGKTHAHYWMPEDPNLHEDTKGALHIGGQAGRIVPDVLVNEPAAGSGTATECHPLWEFEDGTPNWPLSSEGPLSTFDKDWMRYGCSRERIQLNRTSPELPEEVTQPIFNTQFFDKWISDGKFMMSNIGLIELSGENVYASIKSGVDQHKDVLQSPEAHLNLRSYFEFPFYPGYYRSTGFQSSNIGDNPWNRRRERSCGSDPAAYTSDLKHYKHEPFDPATGPVWDHSRAPSKAWSEDPAWGYCDYCGHDKCCCNRLNNTKYIREVMNYNKVAKDGALAGHTGWSTESPLNRNKDPCVWQEEWQTCGRKAVWCSDCNDAGPFSAESCCLNLSQAPDGPRCTYDPLLASCSIAPLDCNGCNSQTNAKDCCDVKRDECSWLPTQGECVDIPDRCQDCLTENCCDDIAEVMMCDWVGDQCESAIIDCNQCAEIANDPTSGTLDLWVEGCCASVTNAECVFENDQCFPKPTDCNQCNSLEEELLADGQTLSSHREDCCSYGGIECMWLGEICYDDVKKCHECNPFELSHDCCDLVGLTCLWDDTFGCHVNPNLPCKDCNAVPDRQECCDERSWCGWYSKPEKVPGETSDVGVCLPDPGSCDGCNDTPFIADCCSRDKTCAMFDKLCHDIDFVYINPCSDPFMMGDVAVASMGLSFFGLLAAMLTHWALSDPTPDELKDVDVGSFDAGAEVDVVNQADVFDEEELLQSIEPETFRSYQ